MKMESSPIKTLEFATPRFLNLSSGIGFPFGALLLATQLIFSDPGHADTGGSTSRKPIYFSTLDCQDPAYSTEKPTFSGTLLLGGEPLSPARTALGAVTETSLPIAPSDIPSGNQPLSIDLDSIHRAQPFFETPALFGLVVLFILSVNIDSLAKHERLLDFLALSFASIAEALKRMALPKRRWKWTLRTP